MTLRHLDFPSGQVGLYGTNPSFLLNGTYAQAANIGSPATTIFIEDDPDPNITGNVLRISRFGSVEGILRWVYPSNQAKAGVARRLWLPSLPNTATRPFIFEFRSPTNSVMASVSVDTTGRIVGVVGADTLTSTNPAIVANAWQHVEACLDRGASTLEVRVEGVTVLEMTGVIIGTDISQVSFRNVVSANPDQYLKDLAIWDGSGASNNDFMGSIQVYELIPTADVAMNWTASTGATGWNLLDESPPNDDADYIFAVSPPPAASRFDVSNLPPDITSVRGLVVVARSRKTDGGDGNLQVGLVSGASTALGANRPITTAFTYWSDVFETDPATGAAWLPAAVDAVQLQVNRTL